MTHVSNTVQLLEPIVLMSLTHDFLSISNNQFFTS
jgi:hypothetical protein